MKELYFNEDIYKSLEGRRKLGDKLFLNTRFYFLMRYFKIILKCRSYAIKGTYNRNMWAKTSKLIFDLLEDCGAKFQIEGLNNIINNNEPVVYIANHMSTLETMVLPSMIAPVQPATFVVKESLLTFPFFGPVMKARDPIAVGRTNPREDYKKVMSEGERLLKEGTSIIIFPQSTRSVEFDEKSFGSLGIKLAQKAKVKVIPIALKTDFWANAKFIKDLGALDRTKEVRIKIGEAMEIHGKGNEEHKAIIDFISSNLLSWNGSVKIYEDNKN